MTDEEKRKHQDWEDQTDQAMEGQPAGRCFKSVYPDPRVIEIPCGTPPTKPLGHPPRYRTFVSPENATGSAPGASSPQPAASGANGKGKANVHSPTVGGGGSTDYMAQIVNPTGYIGNYSSAKGSFTQLTHAPTTDYSLQLNSNTWPYSTLCGGVGSADNCFAWQQFAYTSTTGLFMQYWLGGFLLSHSACPTGWLVSDQDCYVSSAPVTGFKINANILASATLTASIVSGGQLKVVLTDSAERHFLTAPDLLGLGIPESTSSPGEGWVQAEFNILGNTDSNMAIFPAKTKVGVKVNAVPYNGATSSRCVLHSNTGEQNNLTLGACTASATGISFPETSGKQAL